MTDSLLGSLGLYGATFAVAFLAGMFPLLSIEAFLFGFAKWAGLDAPALIALIAIAAVGHQLAKTVTYYAGAGVFELPRGKMRERIERAKQRVERWNRRPRLVMLAAAAVGLPPLWAMGFVARPLMKMTIATFTSISMGGRVARYVTIVVAAQLMS